MNSTTDNDGARRQIPIQIVVWIVSSAGISGLIVALGFVVDVGFQERLGYQLDYGRPVSAYLIGGGKFIMATFFHFVVWLSEYFLVWVPILVVSIAGAIIYRKIGNHHRQSFHQKYDGIPKVVIILSLYLLVGLDIRTLDFPSVQISGLLIQGLDPSFKNEDDLLQFFGTKQIWLKTVCARFDSSLYLHLTQVNVNCEESPQSHTDYLRNLYLLNFALTGIFLYVSIAFFTRNIFDDFLQATLLILLNVINIAFLPYSYGKTIAPTTFNEVIIHVADENQKIQDEHGFLLSRDDHVTVIFHKDEQHIWMLPTDKVVLSKLERQGDVLQYYLKKVFERAQESPEPPI